MTEQQRQSDDQQRPAAHDHLPGALGSALRAEKAAYEDGADRPLGSYAALTAGYVAAVIGLGAVARRRGARLRLSLGDVVLATVATAKISRLIAKDPIISFLRAPFTRFQGQSGEAELAEEVRGSGPRHAIGELLTCPFCLGPWVGGSLVAAHALAPGVARATGLIGTMAAGADVMQYGFAGIQQVWKQLSEEEGDGGG